MRLAARNGRDQPPHVQPGRLPIVVAGKTGTAEFGTRDSQGRLPYHDWFVGVRARRSVQRRTSRKPDSQLAVVAFAYERGHGRQRGDRDRQVLPAAALRDHEGLPRCPELLRQRQLLPGAADGRPARRARPRSAMAARSVGAVWRAFDLQLTSTRSCYRDRPRDGLQQQRRVGRPVLAAAPRSCAA